MVWTKAFRARVHLFGAIFLRPLPLSMFVSFAVDSMIQGNHVYKDIWDNHLEELACRHKRNEYPRSFRSCCVKIRHYCRPYTKSNIGCLLCIPWMSRIYKIASTALSICSSPSLLHNEIKAQLRQSLQYNSSMDQLQLFIKRQN